MYDPGSKWFKTPLEVKYLSWVHQLRMPKLLFEMPKVALRISFGKVLLCLQEMRFFPYSDVLNYVTSMG